MTNWTSTKLKISALLKKSRIEGQATEWKKTFTNHMSYKGLLSRIYKELKVNSKKTNNTIRIKCPRDLTRLFTIEVTWLANKPTSCSASLVTRKMPIKITSRDHYTVIRMSKIKKQKKIKIYTVQRFDEDTEQPPHSWEFRMLVCKTVWQFLIK